MINPKKNKGIINQTFAKKNFKEIIGNELNAAVIKVHKRIIIIILDIVWVKIDFSIFLLIRNLVVIIINNITNKGSVKIEKSKERSVKKYFKEIEKGVKKTTK